MQPTHDTASPPDVALHIVKAFNAALSNDALPLQDAVAVADLMLELASLHHYAGMLRKERSADVEQELNTCRERIVELNQSLGLELTLPA